MGTHADNFLDWLAGEDEFAQDGSPQDRAWFWAKHTGLPEPREVHRETGDQGRWMQQVFLVFKFEDGSLLQSCHYEGLTENQEDDYDLIEWDKVEEYIKTEIAYRAIR